MNAREVQHIWETYVRPRRTGVSYLVNVNKLSVTAATQMVAKADSCPYGAMTLERVYRARGHWPTYQAIVRDATRPQRERNIRKQLCEQFTEFVLNGK